MKNDTEFKEITFIDAWSLSYILGGIFFAFGLILSSIYTLAMWSSITDSNFEHTLGNIASLILTPLGVGIVSAVGGYVSGLVVGIAYNLTANRFGGLQFTVKEIEEAVK